MPLPSNDDLRKALHPYFQKIGLIGPDSPLASVDADQFKDLGVIGMQNEPIKPYDLGTIGKASDRNEDAIQKAVSDSLVAAAGRGWQGEGLNMQAFLPHGQPSQPPTQVGAQIEPHDAIASAKGPEDPTGIGAIRGQADSDAIMAAARGALAAKGPPHNVEVPGLTAYIQKKPMKVAGIKAKIRKPEDETYVADTPYKGRAP